MNKHLPFKRIFVSVLIFFNLAVSAGITHFPGPTLENTFSPYTPVIVNSNATTSVFPMTDPSYHDVSVTDIITLSVKHEPTKFVTLTGNIVLALKVEKWDKNNVSIGTDYPSMELNYQPFPSSGLPYVDKSVYKFNNAYKIKITVQGINVNGSAVTNLPDNLAINSDILLERYINFVPSLSTVIAMYTPVQTDLNCDDAADELELSWATLAGAEEYQLEWTFVNNYDVANYEKDPSALSYNFRGNSTRITTALTTYKINLNFDKGYLIYKVRGIGRDFNKQEIPLPGVWNLAADSSLVSSVPGSNIYFKSQAHEANKNWQYSATYAEEGKRKEVISYFDGSLRNRQTVTKINSDDNTLAGETIYDHQGRPAINILPAPVKNPVCSTARTGLVFYPNINNGEGTSVEYSRKDFDTDMATTDSCSSKVLVKMDKAQGTSRYYSANTDRTLPQSAFIPDAELYPFSQTEYTPDNTGRIRRQGGVGKDFQLGTDHETKYYYGSPAQAQLDRLFGSEVGDASHYKKNVVRDANGQYSVTYLDQEGRTVATALAGNGPSYMDTLLTPNKNTGSLNVDLFNKNLNGVSAKNVANVQGDAIEFSSQLTVAHPNNYVFNYDISIAQFPQGCLKSGICYNCIYDLEVSVTDDCGKVVTGSGNPVKKMIGRFTADGSGNFVSFNTTCVAGNYTNAQSFTLVNLQAGNYTVTKRLTVNKDAKEYYLANYFQTTNTPVQGTYVNLSTNCIKTYQQFVDASMAKIDTADCNVSCDACVASLKGSYATLELARDGFVADKKGTELDFDYLIEQCTAACKQSTACETNYQMMLLDVSPDGQYGEYQPRDNGNQPDMNLSVFNPGNRLLKNGSGKGNWHYPSITINGNTYGVYIDKNGVRTKIPLIDKGITGGVQKYSPEVISNTQVLYDAATQTYFTYPENLVFLSDFINKWDDNWAKSLVSYHPEYMYYQSCLQYSQKFAGYNLTSDSFDSVLVNCRTFNQAATSYGLISATVSADMILFNKSAQPVKDPFIFNFGSYGSDLNAQIASYNGSGLSMQQYAAKVVRCGTMYGATSLPSTCTDFGTGSDAAILDGEWNVLKNLYLSAKQAQQKKKDEALARANRSYNGCIGNPDYSAVTSGMLSYPVGLSQYADPNEPCGFWLKQFYIDKKKRFNASLTTTGDLPTKEENDYQMYIQTGQTPMELNVQGLLSSLAGKNSLTDVTTSGKALQYVSEFSPDLYTAVYGSTPLPGTYVSYFWKASSVLTNSISANIITSGGTVKIAFTLSKVSTAFTWSQIKSISMFKYTGGSGPFNFKAVAAVANPVGSIRPYTYYEITGTTQFVLNGYNPTPSTLSKCKTNPLALDLANLWSAIALNGSTVFNSTTQVNLNTTDYQPFLTNSIKNALGAISNNLYWKYNPGSTPVSYELYETATKKMVMQVDSGSTTGLVMFVNMRNLNTVNGNAFRVTGNSSSGAEVGKMKGSININNNSVITPVNLGDCGLPENVLCTGNEYQTGKDMLKLLKSVMLPKPFNSNPDLTKSPAYTPLLESYLGTSVSGSTTKYDYITLNGANDYKEQITYNMLCKCQIRLWHKGAGTQIIKFADLSALNSLVPYGPATMDNNTYAFYMYASYTYMSTTVTDTIFGESCFPLRSCDNKTVADTAVSPTKPYVNPCIMNQINIANLNAQTEFKKYSDSLLTDLGARYTRHCLGAAENLKAVYNDKEYHYTLYYYDQAGNLVKTIPPEGVELVPAADFPKIAADRDNNRHDYFTQHRMASTYTYNSLNQLVRQMVPDQDSMDVWEYTLVNGLDSRLKVTSSQFLNSTKGYLTGSLTVGGINRGYLYTTDDGGTTWKKVNDLLASDLKKVQMVSATTGYAVGTAGTFLKSTDGGISWDLVVLPVTTTINDLFFNPGNVSNGLIIGENSAVYLTKDGGTTWTLSNTGIAASTSLTSITFDNTSFYITGNVSGSGKIYKVTGSNFATASFALGLPWGYISNIAGTGIRSTDIIKINMVNTTRGFAIAADGNLLKTTDAGLTWTAVPTGIASGFRDICFLRMTNFTGEPLCGIAIIDSIPGKGLVYQTADGGASWKQLSANDGSYYNAIHYTPSNRDKGYVAGTKLKRIVFNKTTASFALVNLPMPNNLAPIDLKTVWFTDPNNGWVASLTSAYFTKNAMAANPTWVEIPASGFNIKKIYFGNTTENSGLLLASSGDMYKITPSGATYLFTKISTTEKFVDMDAGNTRVYAFNTAATTNCLTALTRAGITGASAMTTVTSSPALAASDALKITTMEVDSVEGFVLLGGADGRLFKSNAPSTTVTWTDYSKITTLPLYDIESPGFNTVYAVGAEGTLLQSTDGANFRVQPTNTVKQLNAIRFNKNGFTAITAVTGLIAGNDGYLNRLGITSGGLITYTQLNSTTTSHLTDLAVKNNGTAIKAYVAGAGGTLLSIADVNSPVIKMGSPKPAVDYSGVSFSVSGNDVIAVGNKSSLYTYNGTSGAKVNGLYIQALQDVNFVNTQNGYVIGYDKGIRYTSDGGQSWKNVIKTTAQAISAVGTFAPGKAIIVGPAGYLGTLADDVLTSSTLGSVAYNDIEFNGLTGYIIGQAAYKVTINPTTYAPSYALISGFPASSNFYGVHIFKNATYNNSFIAVGDAGKIYSYNGTTWVSIPLLSGSPALKDVYFHDDRNGYAVGTGGAIYKCRALADIPGYSTSPPSPWSTRSLAGINGAAAPASTNLYTVGFADRYKGFIGGEATSGSPLNFARMLTDESGLFSTRYWYDALGRMVVSQNTKQYNRKDLATQTGYSDYSYTLYDALGRITEVGEKTDNVVGGSIIGFAGIFGAYVNGRYNPYVINAANFLSWVTTGTARREVTATYYDAPISATAPGNAQQNLRKRVSVVTYEDVNDGNPLTYDYGTYYSYDIHGNVKSLWQHNKSLPITGQDLKQIDYEYDLISGKVNLVRYQDGKADCFYHFYTYDADNRITEVYTSSYPWAGQLINQRMVEKNRLWSKDAKYFYYAHGPLSRVETGEFKSQGTDYAYTLQGWIKGVNSNILKPGNDIGNDGVTAGVNEKVALDAFGYSLTYFTNDYKPIDAIGKWNTVSTRFVADQSGSDLLAARSDLYNGNISAMVSNMSRPKAYSSANEAPVYQPQGTAYRYDHLNRLKQLQAYTNVNTATNAWQSGSSYGNSYKNTFTYDGNGNILSQVRYNGAGTKIDDLTYNYFRSAGKLMKNRLRSVGDVAPAAAATDDLENQAATNYGYDALGNLLKDEKEDILRIEWNVYGKIKKVIRTTSSSKTDLEFKYDASGNRIAKIEKPHGSSVENGGSNVSSSWKTTYYVRDAQGNVMGNYYLSYTSLPSYKLLERDLYGSSRLGTENTQLELIGAPQVSNPYPRVLGKKYFEGTNHLGNVLSIYTDKKIPVSSSIIYSNDMSSSYSPPFTFSSGAVTSINGGRLKVTVQGQYHSARMTNMTTISGHQYKITVDVDLAGMGNMAIFASDAASGTDFTVTPIGSTATYTNQFTATGALTHVYFQNSAVGARTFYLDNVSIEDLTVSASPTISYYQPEVIACSDYTAFGAPMNERSFKSSGIDKQSNPNYIWNFIGGSLSEVTGSGYTATAVNGPVAGADRCGNANAYVCDGVDDYIKITDNADLDPGAGNFTVSIWVKRLAAQTNWAGNQAVGKWNTGGTAGTNEWVLSINGSIGANTPGGFAIESGTTSYQALGTTTPGLNQWYHLVGMRDGDSIRFYLNGAREAAKYVGTAAVNNVGLDVLIGKLNGGFYSNSVYDDFVYYKRALTGQEVKKLYSAGCDLNDVTAYRYAFNGKEKDDEVKLAGNSYDFGARIYDPRLGKWLSIDSKALKYPQYSPYLMAANAPLLYVDKDGRDIYLYHATTRDEAGLYVFKSGEVSKTTEAVLFDIMRTPEGFAFLSQFAKKGTTIGGYTFKEDGKNSDHDLVITDISLEDDNTNIVADNSGSFTSKYNEKKDNITFNLKLITKDQDKEDVGETYTHESKLHGSIVGTFTNAFKIGGKEGFLKAKEEEERVNKGGENEHEALKNRNFANPGFKGYEAQKWQLIKRDPKYLPSFEKAKTHAKEHY